MKIRDNTSIVILAAGLGKRMKSPIAKVLHEMDGKPLIEYVVKAAQCIVGNNIVVVIGNQAEQVRKIVSSKFNVNFAYQDKQLGTGHAVLCAFPYIPTKIQEVLILCGDVPLIQPSTLDAFVDYHMSSKNDASIIAVETSNPYGYGRLIIDHLGMLCGIVEEADATEEQKKIKLINTGIICLKKEFLFESLPKAGLNNAQGEIYLTEIVEIGFNSGKKVGAWRASCYDEFVGINTPDDLKHAEQIFRTTFHSKIT